MAHKNAKVANRGVGKGGGFVPSPLVRRLVPLNGGAHAYLADENGKNRQWSTADPAFVAELARLDGIFEGRIAVEVADLADRFGGRWVELVSALAAAPAPVEDAA